MTPGNELHPDDQRHVLAAYVHRFTRTHRPAWATSRYKPQFENDADWLRNTVFHTRRDGRLDARHRHCESSPTWPDGITNPLKGVAAP